MLHAPVAFIIFNRPETTEQVFTEIAKVKPTNLFVIADGPREGQLGEAAKCAAARAIIERVDWECEVFKNYSDMNLGLARRVATGISWVFEHVEEAIILEDDCVPDPTFFQFCEELLEKYRDDERIMQIGGEQDLYNKKQIPYSYYFARLPTCWGWATWHRAWQHYDFEMKLWPELRETSWLENILTDPRGVEFFRNNFERTYEGAGKADYSWWACQWTFTVFVQSGLVVLPNTNLISNIGFGKEAFHTKNPNSMYSNIPPAAMKFPLRHPPYMVGDREADQIRWEQSPPAQKLSKQPSVYLQLRRRLSAVIPGPLRKLILSLRRNTTSRVHAWQRFFKVPARGRFIRR